LEGVVPAKVTAVDDVIVALVAALKAAVTYEVSDGPVTKRPARDSTQLLVIGSEEPWNDEDGNATNSAMMQQVWKGLGQASRDETMQIPCVAVGYAYGGTVAAARGLAKNAVQDAFNNLNPHPTSATYNALVSDVGSVESRNQAGGAVVTIKFTISASARLI
jgi:hypothetical protein